MSTISAGTTISTALVSAGDTTGALVLKTGASATTAMTIGADQSVTFTGTVFGLGGGGATPSGSVTLTATSAGAQSITTTDFGQTVTLPNATTLLEGGNLYNINNLGAYPLKIVNNAGSTLGFVFTNCPVIVGLADNSTAAGTWNLVGAEPFAVVAQTFASNLYNKTQSSDGRKIVALDANRILILIGRANSINGIIYDSSTNTWGTLTLIRSDIVEQVEAILSAPDQVLVNSSDNTAMEAVVLTISGLTISVGIAATATLSAGNTGSNTGGNLIAVGSSFVITYTAVTPQMRAMTISGTTVTIGAATVLNGTNVTSATANIYVAAASSSVVLVLTNTTASTFFATPYTVSGTTITLGSGATYASTAANEYIVRPISSGARWAVVITSTAGTTVGIIISVSGANVTTSTVTLATSGGTPGSGVLVSGSKLIYVGAGTARTNILTDTAGTASAGTDIGYFSSDLITPISANATTSLATFYFGSNNRDIVSRAVISFAGSSPVLVGYDHLGPGTATGNINTFADNEASTYKATYTPTFFIGTTSYAWDLSEGVGVRAIAISENCFYSFFPKFMPVTGGGESNWNSISANKVLVYNDGGANVGLYGFLQIVESVS
jgi:hypothetical protein